MNKEKLIELRDFMAANPDKVHMSSWISECGTTACAAGHAALLDGVTMPGENILAALGTEWTINVTTKVSRWRPFNEEMGEDDRDIMDYAQHILGLSYDDANRLFLHTPDAYVLDLLNELIRKATAREAEAR